MKSIALAVLGFVGLSSAQKMFLSASGTCEYMYSDNYQVTQTKYLTQSFLDLKWD